MLQRILEQEESVRTTLCLLSRNDLAISGEEVEIINGIVERCLPLLKLLLERFQHISTFQGQKLFHYQGHYKGLLVLVSGETC